MLIVFLLCDSICRFLSFAYILISVASYQVGMLGIQLSSGGCWRSSYQVGMLEIQLSRWDVGDPVTKRGCWRSSYQVEMLEIQLSSGEGWNPINLVNSVTFLCLSQARTWISNVISVVVICYAQWVKVKGYWYWWNCNSWPSLFTLSFHNVWSDLADNGVQWS